MITAVSERPSFDDICKMNFNGEKKQKLAEIFPVGLKVHIDCFSDYKLTNFDNTHKQTVFFTNLHAEVIKNPDSQELWIVSTDRDGNRFGLPILTMLNLHRDGDIELEYS